MNDISKKIGIAGILLSLTGFANTAAATVILTGGDSVFDVGAASQFSFSFSTVFPVLTGQQQISISLLGVYADGGRNGASLTPSSASGQLMDVGIGGSTVVSTGAAQSFTGAGGTGGTTLISPFVVKDVGAASTFSLISSTGIPQDTAADTLSAAMGGGVVDGGTDGASGVGTGPNNSIGRSDHLGGLTQGGTLLGTSPIDNTAAFFDISETSAGCSTNFPCTGLFNENGFIGSGGGDFYAFLTRSELGGSSIGNGTVLSSFLFEETAVFDCATLASCNSIATNINFLGSGLGDAVAFAYRVEIDDFIDDMSAVPTPGTFYLFAAGFIALTRYRTKSRSAT